MPGEAVSVSIEVDASGAVVWRYLTDDRDAWWREMRFEPVVGSPLAETWVDHGREASATGIITRCDAPHLLGFSWTEQGWAQPLEVEIGLVARGQRTVVTVTESGFSRAGTAPSLLGEHEEGWRYHLARWKRACEGEDVEMDAPGQNGAGLSSGSGVRGSSGRNLTAGE